MVVYCPTFWLEPKSSKKFKTVVCFCPLRKNDATAGATGLAIFSFTPTPARTTVNPPIYFHFGESCISGGFAAADATLPLSSDRPSLRGLRGTKQAEAIPSQTSNLNSGSFTDMHNKVQQPPPTVGACVGMSRGAAWYFMARTETRAKGLHSTLRVAPLRAGSYPQSLRRHCEEHQRRSKQGLLEFIPFRDVQKGIFSKIA